MFRSPPKDSMHYAMPLACALEKRRPTLDAALESKSCFALRFCREATDVREESFIFAAGPAHQAPFFISELGD